MFNCPYSNDSFPPYSELIPGDVSSTMLSQAAKEHQVTEKKKKVLSNNVKNGFSFLTKDLFDWRINS